MVLKIQLIELRNGMSCVIHNLSEIKVPPREDVIKAYGGAFLGGYGILQKDIPERVANITSHYKKTTNPKKILTQFHS